MVCSISIELCSTCCRFLYSTLFPNLCCVLYFLVFYIFCSELGLDLLYFGSSLYMKKMFSHPGLDNLKSVSPDLKEKYSCMSSALQVEGMIY